MSPQQQPSWKQEVRQEPPADDSKSGADNMASEGAPAPPPDAGGEKKE
jgi:hypothetical protein